MQKTSVKLPAISGKEQNLNKQMSEFEIFIFCNTLYTFSQNSILFHGLEKRFHNSILFQYFPYRIWTLCVLISKCPNQCFSM